MQLGRLPTLQICGKSGNDRSQKRVRGQLYRSFSSCVLEMKSKTKSQGEGNWISFQGSTKW